MSALTISVIEGAVAVEDVTVERQGPHLVVTVECTSKYPQMLALGESDGEVEVFIGADDSTLNATSDTRPTVVTVAGLDREFFTFVENGKWTFTLLLFDRTAETEVMSRWSRTDG